MHTDRKFYDMKLTFIPLIISQVCIWFIWCLGALPSAIASDAGKNLFIYRTVLKNGFHRELQTTIKVPHDLFKNVSGCTFAVMDTFPDSIYIDPFQMLSLQMFGGPQFVSPDVNVESPAYLSEQLSVTVFAPKMEKDGDDFRTRVTIPIHLRYHKPEAGKNKKGILIQAPEFLMHCDRKTDFQGEVLDEVRIPCSQNKTKICKWNKVFYKTDVTQIHLDIPIGNADHITRVVVCTLASAIGGCVLLFITVWRKVLKETD